MLVKSLFLIIAFGVLFLMSLYTYRRFFKKITFLQAYQKRIKLSLVALFVIITLGLMLQGYAFFYQIIYMYLTYFIGIIFMLFSIAVVYDLLHISFDNVPFEKSRRHFLKIAFDATFLILSISYLFKGFINGLKDPILTRIPIKIKGLGKSGFKIVQLSDLHIGNTLKKAFVERIVQRVNSLDPDMVVITGDLIDADLQKIKDDLKPLQDLTSVHGTYFVLGNHEYFHGAEESIVYVKSLGIKVLSNESVIIENQFNLVGLHDYMGYRLGYLQPDVQKAYTEIDRDLPTIVLAHQPKLIKELEVYEPDLVLSGHTHGGQIFPFGLLVLLDQPYLSGLYQHNQHTQIFVSNGTGFWGPAIRFMADSEIVEITLV